MARYPTMGYLLRVKKILSSRIQIYLLYCRRTYNEKTTYSISETKTPKVILLMIIFTLVVVYFIHKEEKSLIMTLTTHENIIHPDIEHPQIQSLPKPQNHSIIKIKHLFLFFWAVSAILRSFYLSKNCRCFYVTHKKQKTLDR